MPGDQRIGVRRADWLGLAAVAVVAAIPRAIVLLRAPAFITNDSLSYLLPGFDLANGLGFEPIFKRPPAYPAFVGAALWFFGQQDLVGPLLGQHLVGIATAVLAYVLGRLLFGPIAAWVAGLLTALSGPLIVTEHYVMSESLFGLWLSVTLVCFTLAARGRSPGWLAATGVALGLAALTRPVAQLLLPVLGLVCFVVWPRWRPAAGAALLLALCYLTLTGPWMARNAAVQGSPTLAGGIGEGLAVRTIRLDQEFDFRDPTGSDRLRTERRIYREEARQGSAFELAQRLRSEAGLSPAEADRAMREIAVGAILQKPDYYVVGSLEMFGRMLIGRPVRPRQDWQPWRGIEWEERVRHLLPSLRPDQDREFELFQQVVTLYDPNRWAPILLMLFGLGCLAAARRPDRLIALLPAVTALALLLVSAFLVGLEWRYRFPLDPLINVMIGAGVGLVASVAGRSIGPVLARSGIRRMGVGHATAAPRGDSGTALRPGASRGGRGRGD